MPLLDIKQTRRVTAICTLEEMHNSFRLIYLIGGKRAPRVAQPGDFVPGTTVLSNGKEIGVKLSSAAAAEGFTSFARGPERKIADEALSGWFKAAIFGGDDLLSAYGPALIEAGVIIVFLFCFAVPWDFKRGKRMKYGRLLRGPVMSSPKEFNQILKGEGLGIRTDEKGTIICLPLRAEAKHVQVMGDTGVGKTTLLIQMLTQIEDRGESAIVYDPAGEYIQRFYREDRNDVILNPLDDRSFIGRRRASFGTRQRPELSHRRSTSQPRESQENSLQRRHRRSLLT